MEMQVLDRKREKKIMCKILEMHSYFHETKVSQIFLQLLPGEAWEYYFMRRHLIQKSISCQSQRVSVAAAETASLHSEQRRTIAVKKTHRLGIETLVGL